MSLKKGLIFIAMLAMTLSFTGCPSKPSAETGSSSEFQESEEPEDVVLEKMKAAETEATNLVKENHDLRVEINKAKIKLGEPTTQEVDFEDEDGPTAKTEAKQAAE